MGIIRNKVVETNIRRRVKLFISFYNRENKLISIQRVQIQMKIAAIEYVYMNEYLVSISTFACILYKNHSHIYVHITSKRNMKFSSSCEAFMNCGDTVIQGFSFIFFVQSYK